MDSPSLLSHSLAAPVGAFETPAPQSSGWWAAQALTRRLNFFQMSGFSRELKFVTLTTKY